MTGFVIEAVYEVSFVDGVMVSALVEGDLCRGDRVFFEDAEGSRIAGEIGPIHVHVVDGDPPERLRLALLGPIANAIGPGDLVKVEDGLGDAPCADGDLDTNRAVSDTCTDRVGSSDD